MTTRQQHWFNAAAGRRDQPPRGLEWTAVRFGARAHLTRNGLSTLCNAATSDRRLKRWQLPCGICLKRWEELP